MKDMSSTRRISVIVVFIALGVVLSPLNILMGPTKAFPMQHMINAIVGVLFGPFYAAFVAAAIGTIRITLGVGTIFSYPGGIPGGLVVGLFHRYVKNTDYAAFLEPIGTSIGAIFSALIVVQFLPRAMPPIFGIQNQVALWVIYWLFSCVPGSVLGFFVIKVMRRIGIVERMLLKGSHQ